MFSVYLGNLRICSCNWVGGAARALQFPVLFQKKNKRTADACDRRSPSAFPLPLGWSFPLSWRLRLQIGPFVVELNSSDVKTKRPCSLQGLRSLERPKMMAPRPSKAATGRGRRNAGSTQPVGILFPSFCGGAQG